MAINVMPHIESTANEIPMIGKIGLLVAMNDKIIQLKDDFENTILKLQSPNNKLQFYSRLF